MSNHRRTKRSRSETARPAASTPVDWLATGPRGGRTRRGHLANLPQNLAKRGNILRLSRDALGCADEIKGGPGRAILVAGRTRQRCLLTTAVCQPPRVGLQGRACARPRDPWNCRRGIALMLRFPLASRSSCSFSAWSSPSLRGQHESDDGAEHDKRHRTLSPYGEGMPTKGTNAFRLAVDSAL